MKQDIPTRLSISEVLALIGQSGYGLFECVDGNTYKARLNSLRLQTFKEKGTVCSLCGKVATHFTISFQEKHLDYHLNLFSGNTLMTHDHIVARSLGGPDHLDNSRTLCGPCNWHRNDGYKEGSGVPRVERVKVCYSAVRNQWLLKRSRGKDLVQPITYFDDKSLAIKTAKSFTQYPEISDLNDEEIAELLQRRQDKLDLLSRDT